jgi:alanyl-tRNA synthetase
MIKLYKAEKTKGHTRIYFRCGWRVLDDYTDSLAINDAIAARFNTGRKDIVGRFEKWDEEQRQQRDELERLRRENDQFVVHQLLAQVEPGDAHPLVHYEWESRSLQDLQRIANMLLEQGELAILLSSADERKVVLAQQGHPILQCGAFFKQHLASFGGKGGGNDRMAQAGFESLEQLREFVRFAQEQLRGE